MAESDLLLPFELSSSFPSPSPPPLLARRLFMEPSSSDSLHHHPSPLSLASDDAPHEMATLIDLDTVRDDLETTWCDGMKRVECDLREALDELKQENISLERRIADLEVFRMGTSWVANELTDLLTWRQHANNKFSRILLFVHQMESSPVYSLSQAVHFLAASLRRVQAALPFFSVLGAFLVIAFVDMVLLGYHAHGLPLLVALVASLSVERVLHCWE
ncbi:hypothetical protein BKA70DRAFT_1423504 [Coprinopsis sp. MPI-PUGE-AT-0042]|nr:hypothetical protein BKA70DRAFT_1423504 [Coprinopsis sp. MPI-PUGE-AT-0042]